MADNSKRKTWKSTSTSSEEESFSPTDKKVKINESLTEYSETCEQDEVDIALNMAESVIPKLEMVLEKLDRLDSKLDSLEKYVKAVDGKVSELQAKVQSFDKFTKDTTKSITELDEGMVFANAERESLKANLKETEKKFTEELNKLREEKINMEVYQRRENLRFHGIGEETASNTEEDTEAVLVEFIKNELDIANAEEFEFQRVHRVGKRRSAQEKPRQIIARFLRYPDREQVMANARKLKGKEFGISADFPKEIVERRKKKMHILKKAKKEGKSAHFSRSEPDKLLIDGVPVP